MAKKTNPIDIDDIRPADLPAFRRAQWFETAKTGIQIFLMGVCALVLFAFFILLFLAGVTTRVLPQTDGVNALSQLFIEVTMNAKTVFLFALGFFFREYLNAKGLNK